MSPDTLGPWSPIETGRGCVSSSPLQSRTQEREDAAKS